jgi:hypothetical protein
MAIFEKKKKKISCIFFQFLAIKTLDPDSLEMLDPDPYRDPDSMNPDPTCLQYNNFNANQGTEQINPDPKPLMR